jgi:hypothetical protein
MKHHFQTQRKIFERACHFCCTVSNLKNASNGSPHDDNASAVKISQPQASKCAAGLKSILAQKGML